MNRSELVSVAIAAILLGATAAAAAGFPASGAASPAGASNGCGGASGCGSAPTQAATVEAKPAAPNGCGGVAGCGAPKQPAAAQPACEGDACATADD